MSNHYVTRFGSLQDYEKGRVEPIDDDVKNYAFSNCFEIANNSAPYEKIVFGQNMQYVLETLRAEGDSPWFTCAHDEFALCMDGELEIHLIKLNADKAVQDAEKKAPCLWKVNRKVSKWAGSKWVEAIRQCCLQVAPISSAAANPLSLYCKHAKAI